MTAPAATRHAAPWRVHVREWLICLSLANLYFLNVWIELSNTSVAYLRKAPPRPAMIAALLVQVALLAVCFRGALAVIRRLPPRWSTPVAGGGILLALIVPLNIFRTSLAPGALDALEDQLGSAGYAIVAASVIGAGIGVLVSRTTASLRAISTALLLLAPLLPILLAQALWVQWRRPSDAAFAMGPAGRTASTAKGTRLLWMVFDEWDYRLVFGDRPPGLSLPIVDGVRAESFSATHLAGGGYGTYNAIASMLTGQRVVHSTMAGPADLILRMDTGPGQSQRVVPWSSLPSIFSDLRTRGWSTAVVGWYHPYCRIVASQVDRCAWEPGASIYGRREYLETPTFTESLELLGQRQLAKIPLANRLKIGRSDTVRRALALEEYTRIRAHAWSAIGSADLVYIHWPLPHPFGVQRRGPECSQGQSDPNYIDNLMLVDDLLGEVRAKLRADGTWDSTMLILSSDHSLRVREWDDFQAWTEEEERVTRGRQVPYVPLLIKFPGQHPAFTYDKPFSIVLMRDLVRALAIGDVATPEGLAAWLDEHRHRFPTPTER